MCPRKHQLGKKYEPKVTAAALAEGDVFHLCLGKMYAQANPDAGREIFQVTRDNYMSSARAAGAKSEAIERLEQKFSNLFGMLEAYATYIVPKDLDKYEVLAVEKEFMVPLERGLKLRGFIDGVFRDKQSGVRYIVEHKYKSKHEDDLMPLDLQVSLYTLALLEEYGPLPTLYNVALKPMNRRGKNESATDFTYRVGQAIHDEMAAFRWTPGEYEGKYFLRRTYSRGKAELTAALQQVRSQNRIMKIVEKDPKMVWRNVGEHCLFMCPFKPICIEEDPLVIDQFYDLKEAPPAAPAVKPI
jgi:CRISPR/Cas system-associated exonuclease Cas4 (RecB family)